MKVDPRAQIHMMSHLNSLAATKRGKKKAFDLDDATEGIEEQKEVTPPQTSHIHATNFAQIPSKKTLSDALKNGEKALESLSILQQSLLSGQLTTEDLEQLKSTIYSSNTPSQLPQEVKNLLSDIQVRVAVELAKRTTL